MARMTITIVDEKVFPHHSFREDTFNFSLEDGFTIIDAHNVLVDIGVRLGKELVEKRKEQKHAQARYLLEEERVDDTTDKELHEKQKCYCYRERKQTDRECLWKEWIDGRIGDREAVARKTEE